jgi:hypothetical protein
MLEATGHSISQIMAVVAVSESTVSRWRRLDEYKAEVSRLQSKHLETVEPLITRVKEGITSGAIEATNALREALNATLPGSESYGEPIPDWEVRMQAANILLRDFKGLVAVAADAGAGQDGGPAQNVNSLTLVIGADQLPPGMAARPANHIDGTATELPAGD